jgi:hypothetical protein
MCHCARFAALGAVLLIAAAVPVSAASIDFQAPFALNTDAATDGYASDEQVRVVGDGAGNLVAVWVSTKFASGPDPSERDILVARSSDGGTTWTDPAALNNNAATDSGDDDGPAITTDRAGHWLVIWSSQDTLGDTIGNDPDILVARSNDNGATWTDPAPLNADAAVDQNDIDQRPAVAMDASGHAIAAWQTFAIPPHVSSDMAIVVARSTDAGVTWSAPVPLSPPDSRNDWQASVAGDGGGHWVVVWRSDDVLNGPFGTDGDLLVAASADDGVTWSSPVPLNDNAATDSADDAEPEVLYDGAGTWLTVWNGGYASILAARSTDNGNTWSAAQTIHSGDYYMPRVATDLSGTWVVAWHSYVATEAQSDIMSAASFDNGTTWLPAVQVNSNPAASTSMDGQPDIASDGLGGWALVWMSNDPLGGDGIDYDLLIAKGEASVSCEELGACAGSRCAMAVSKATGAHADDRLRCYARALRRGLPGDPACEAEKSARCSAAMAKARTYGDCPSTLDETWLSATIQNFYDDVRDALDGTTACGRAKIQRAGKTAAALLKCHAKALHSGTPPSPSCLVKARGRLASGFVAVEAHGGCTVNGDAPALGARVDAFASDVAAALQH